MSPTRREPDAESASVPGEPASGVVLKEESDGAPPWAIVSAYLARGDHATWVEGHAARSHAFAEVLEALRLDHEERATDRGRVLKLPR